MLKVDSSVAVQVLERLARFHPVLVRIREGRPTINGYRLAKMAQLEKLDTARLWFNGRQTPSGLPMAHLLNETLAVAEAERAELLRLKEIHANCECKHA